MSWTRVSIAIALALLGAACEDSGDPLALWPDDVPETVDCRSVGRYDAERFGLDIGWDGWALFTEPPPPLVEFDLANIDEREVWSTPRVALDLDRADATVGRVGPPDATAVLVPATDDVRDALLGGAPVAVGFQYEPSVAGILGPYGQAGSVIVLHESGPAEFVEPCDLDAADRRLVRLAARFSRKVRPTTPSAFVTGFITDPTGPEADMLRARVPHIRLDRTD